MATHGDAAPFDDPTESKKETSNNVDPKVRVIKKTITGKSVAGNKALPADFPNFNEIFKDFPSRFQPPPAQPAGQSQSTKRVHNTFRFKNSSISNAAIGHDGPTTFNNHTTTYQKGASKTNVNVKDGTLLQPNIGGKATFNNENSSLGAVVGDFGEAVPEGFINIDHHKHPFAPEEYLAKLLQTGVSSKELISLLEKNYSIVNLAYSIPSCKDKRDLMIHTMLKMADCEVPMEE